MNRTAACLSLFCLAAVWLISCSPAGISRIGPSLPQRPSNCQLDVFEKDAIPNRPYRDIGMVDLKNCQDYRTPPCSEWLRKAACELGGDVVYLPEEDNLGSEKGPVTFRLMVAAYVGNARGEIADNPIKKSTQCNPLCKENEVCLDGVCRPSDCEEALKAMQKEKDAGLDKCVE